MARRSLQGLTPLMQSVLDGNLPQVQQYISQYNVNQTNQCGYSSLALAVKNGFTEIVQILLDNGADVNQRNNNKIDCVRLLLQRQADTELQDQRGWTPLFVAVHKGLTDIVKLLVSNGCNTNHTDCVSFIQFGKKAMQRTKNVQICGLLQRRESRISKRRKSFSAEDSVRQNLSNHLKIPSSREESIYKRPSSTTPRSQGSLNSPISFDGQYGGDFEQQERLILREEVIEQLKVKLIQLKCNLVEPAVKLGYARPDIQVIARKKVENFKSQLKVGLMKLIQTKVRNSSKSQDTSFNQKINSSLSPKASVYKRFNFGKAQPKQTVNNYTSQRDTPLSTQADSVRGNKTNRIARGRTAEVPHTKVLETLQSFLALARNS